MNETTETQPSNKDDAGANAPLLDSSPPLPGDESPINVDTVASLLLVFSILAILMLLYFIVTDIHNKTHESWDYAAYLFPVLAGISAGYGIYVPNNAKTLFLFSCLFLGIGLACYFLSKDAAGAATVIAIFLALIVVISSVLGDLIDLRMKGPRAVKIVMLCASVAILLGTVGVLAVLAAKLLS